MRKQSFLFPQDSTWPPSDKGLCGLGAIHGLDIICGLSLLLVLVLAPRGFSPGTPVFPSP